ncbi:MAG: hypothetical protein LBH44_00030 [Treponema sp.]|jgi:tetratricopeptide (TPR) repeat protein|nr:hypothetical protein [Treponema sp.]
MRLPKLTGGLFKGGILRITFFAGIILFVLTGIAFTVVFFTGSRQKGRMQEESFFRILREYDRSTEAAAGRDFEKLNLELDRLEKRAIGVESWLSVLKRRRALALQAAHLHPPSAVNYRLSLERAVKAYPWSQPLAALAAAAIVKDTAINRETEEQLRVFLPLLADPAFNTLRLNLHILLGDFRTPARAALLPPFLFSDGTEEITKDFAIMKILHSDIRGAAADIQAVLNSRPPSDDFIRFAAEYFYDFGDLVRSAELFSYIEDDAALLRQADALYLAGLTENARSIWTILANTIDENSLYNLAVTSKDPLEAAFFLEKLATANSKSESRQQGLIRYSRLLSHQQALALLQNKDMKPSDYPFIDLEILKRNSQGWQPGRQVAETWLLLDRHPENEDLYEWAAWLMFYHHFYSETGVLFRRAERFQFAGLWVKFYKAVQLMQEGDLDEAGNILRNISGEWPVYANLGRILEYERSHSRALEQYELAAAKVQDSKTASQIQYRISRCHSAMGRASEVLRTLEYAVELDPGNLTAQLELDRIRQR